MRLDSPPIPTDLKVFSQSCCRALPVLSRRRSLRSGSACRRITPDARRPPRCDTIPATGTAATRRTGKVLEPQIKRLLSKPICKPDAVKRSETGETEPIDRDVTCPVRRGHRIRERLPETPETCVVWLITQR
jgi:hypothetical protein